MNLEQLEDIVDVNFEEPNEYNMIMTHMFKINNTNVYIDLSYSRYNNKMEFGYDDANGIDIKIIRNLSNNKFSNKFFKYLNINDVEISNNIIDVDAINTVSYIKPDDQIYNVVNESLNLNRSKPLNLKTFPYSKNANILNIMGFGLTDYKNQYLFLYFERIKFIKNKNIIKSRTAAIEIYNSILVPEEIIV